MKYTKKLCLLAGTALIACTLICGCGSDGSQDTTKPSVTTLVTEVPATTIPVTTTPTTTVPTTVPMESEPEQQLDLPWENGGKQPFDYTLEEYEALDEEYQIAFQDALGPVEFEIWKEWVQRPPLPWENEGAKQPAEYTWEEFEALSGEHQIAFQNTLGMEAFDAWLNQSLNHAGEYPWDEPGAKQPAEYTWEEFEALSAEHQIAFQNILGVEAFDTWLNQALSQSEEYPWDKPGAKQPAEYTWEEFEALSAEHQIGFQNILGMEAFDAWLTKVQNQTAANPWDAPGAKQPAEYTWEEFEALSGEHQIAFQNVLGFEAFDAWLTRVNP